MRRRYLVAGGLLALLGAAGAFWLVAESEHTENKALIYSLAATASLSFVFTGLVALWRRPGNRTGVLLAATGYLWMLGALTTSNEPWVFTLGWLVNSAAFGAFGHLILAYPSGRLESRYHRVLVAVVWAVLLLPALALLLVGGTDEVCLDADCPQSTLTVWDSGGAARVVLAVSSLGAVVVIALVLAALVVRWRRASAPLRRALLPVFAASAVPLILLAIGVAIHELAGADPRPVEYMAIAALGGVPLAFLAGVLRTRLARAGVGDMLLELARGTPIRDAIAETLSDPTLEIAYWLPDEGRYVFADGKPVPEQDDSRHVSLVEHAGRPTAALLHDPLLADERELIDAVTAAAGLWLDNERLQAKLRAQVEFLETTVDTSPSLLCSLDREGRIANLNLASTRASGYDDQEEVRWQPFWNVFVSPEERDDSRRRWEEAAPIHGAASFEHTFVNRAGQELTIAWSTAPLYDEHGNVRNVICGGLDTTERRRQYRQLLASEERLRAAIEASPVAILEVGLDDCVAMWNPAAEEMFGWSAEEVLGGPVRHVPPERNAELHELFDRVRGGEIYTGIESTRLRKDGTVIDVEISAAPIHDAGGDVVGHLALFADITERKRHEEELRASRARIVEAGDAARRQLERNLHDGAQQRLVALSLSLRLAQSKIGSDPATAEAVLDSARGELAAALDELRELARGIHPAVLTDRGLPAALEALATRSPIPVKIETPDEALPPPVESTAYYVIAEALANVIKYAQASTVTVKVCRDGDCARVEVADDGVGGADPGAGTGLRGLADRVEVLAGALAVESPPGGGTRIRAEIPLKPGPEG